MSASASGLPVSFFDIQNPNCDVLLRTQAAGLRLELNRVNLRPATRKDRTDVLDILRDPEVGAYYMNWSTWRVESAHGYFDRQLLPVLRVEMNERLGSTVRTARLLIEDRQDHLLLGLINIKRSEATGVWEIGYALDGTVRGQGYGTEVVRGMIDAILALDPRAIIEASPRRENNASLALLQKTGFAAAHDAHLPAEMRDEFMIYRRVEPSAFVTLPPAND